MKHAPGGWNETTRAPFFAALTTLAMVCASLGFSVFAAARPVSGNSQWAGCLLAPAATVARVANDVFRYCGPITNEGVAEVRRLLSPGATTLEILSPGGSLDAPLDLAEIVLDRKLRVVVVGQCFSGCASFVFVAGRTRTIQVGGIVGLHNTSSSAFALVKAAKMGALDERDGPLGRRAAREEAIYSRRGISARLLFEAQARIAPVCLQKRTAFAANGENNYDIVSEKTLWVPTKQQWRDFGVEVSGAFPRDAGAAQELLARTMPRALTGSVSIVVDPLPMRDHPSRLLEGIKFCAPRM